MIKAIVFIALGALLLHTGWRHWRMRHLETVSVLEAAVLKATKEAPLPRTGADKALTYIQAIFGFIFGPILMMLGGVLLAGEMQWL
jgi:hypothetical protein